MTLERLNAFLHMIFLEHFLQMQKKQFVVRKKKQLLKEIDNVITAVIIL